MPPPSNRNVPKWMWEDACEKYEGYQRLHKILQDMGLSDQDADEYIDAHSELSHLIERLDPAEEDFMHDDHAEHFARSAGLLALLSFAALRMLSKNVHQWGQNCHWRNLLYSTPAISQGP